MIETQPNLSHLVDDVAQPSRPAAPLRPEAKAPSALEQQPRLPQLVDDGPRPPPQAASKPGTDGEPRATADPEPDPVALAARFPIEFDEDFLPHEPSVNGFRALAARHKLPPAAVQDLATFYVAELRRLASDPDPGERSKAQQPRLPHLNP